MSSFSDPPTITHTPTSDTRRWAVLVVVSLGFVMMTVNWFNIAPAFGQIGAEFHVEIPQVALLISAFVAGYGVFHIPAGFLATRLGLRATLVAGMAVEGIAAALSGLADDHTQLMILRTVCGVGASIYAGIGIAAVSVWFSGRMHAFALGIGSATFALGAALGLYTWADVIAMLGWRQALVVSGALCVVVGLVVGVVYRVPPGTDTLTGVRVTREAVRQTLGNRLLWVYGLAFLGGYGAYFTAAQLIRGYGTDERHFASVGAASLLIGLAGIPGSVIAGWVSDRVGRRRLLILVMLALEAVGLLLIPVAGEGWFWVPAFVVGFAFNGCFAVWQTVPGEDWSVNPENIGTAIGLMLTITAVGGFVIPWLFGLIVPVGGYTTAWLFLGVACLVFALIGLAGREPDPRTPDTVPAPSLRVSG
ncbi:MFS transporter [Streptosporangium carneum]|uniref:MFS transporter n=1 Tax=Streptosporangium carneum TaxID=47481 RepID=A0A9W6MHG2_9ACTN|nr:MFS transporter [Streptosporangium carneum]GLK14142.1 MFS transporter [Streptosporangium carneum]